MTINNTVSKQKRYRMKQHGEMRCPHCGKSCEPYAECAERREYKRIRRRKKDVGSQRIDARHVPRVANKPVIYEDGFIWDMQREGVEINARMFL